MDVKKFKTLQPEGFIIFNKEIVMRKFKKLRPEEFIVFELRNGRK